VDPVRVVTGGDRYTGVQGLSYFAGVSAETAGSHALCLHALTIPPGGRARAHLHEGHESAIYLISGDAVVWFGENLAERLDQHAGDFVYIPAGTPHLPVNASDTEPCIALVARTDPNEQESVVLLPELDGLPHLR
jgi:uncharacterized RmlC-like cupin family protein